MKSSLLSVAFSPLVLGYTHFGSNLYGRSLPSTVPAPSTNGFANATTHFSSGGQAVCVSGMIPVMASTSKNVNLTFTPPTNQSTVTNMILEAITQGSSFMTDIMGNMTTVTGNYSIYATYCTPMSGSNSNSSKVQLLTHGIGFTSKYWDFNSDYSYVDVAASNGYATFSYDRLGVGMSAKPDPIQTVQVALEVEIAATIAKNLMSGKYSNATYSKVIGVGHSFGSIISQAVTAEYPTLFSGVILTGFSANSSAIAPFLTGGTFELASVNNPYDFANANASVLLGGSVISTQTNFFRAPNFDPKIVALATAYGGTVTLGELFTQGAGSMVAKNYTNPVAVVNGANDLPFCFGNCSYPTNLPAAAIKSLYPMVSTNKTATYLAPLTGHGLNLHYTAPAAFMFIQSFLMSQGL